jgi:hypothetical protein
MNTTTVLDRARVSRIAAEHGLTVRIDDVASGGDQWEFAQIAMPFPGFEPSRADVIWDAEAAHWTVDPYFHNDPALTVSQARAAAATMLLAACLAEQLNQPDPDMIVELRVGSPFGYTPGDDHVNLVLLDCSRPSNPGSNENWILVDDEWIGKHQPGDRWGRAGARKDFVGKFDFIRWEERDGRRVALLKHR